jgi:WD40 repeat protein
MSRPLFGWSMTVATLLTIAAPAARAQAVDQGGDPLPAGALARIGATRFRPGHVVDGLAFTAGGKELVSVHATGIQVWDPASGKLLRSYGGGIDRHAPTAIAPDGAAAVLLEQDAWVVRATATGKVLGSVPLTAESRARRVALAKGGRLLAMVAEDNHLRVWDVASGDVVLEQPHEASRRPPLTFTPDGKFLVTDTKNGEVVVWSLAANAPAWTAGRDSDFLPPQAMVSADGTTLAVVINQWGELHLWDMATSKPRLKLPRRQDGYLQCAFTADGSKLISFGQKQIAVWDAATGQLQLRFNIGNHNVTHLAVSPDGRWLAGAERPWTRRLRIWALADGTERRPDAAPAGAAVQARYLSDGKTVTTSGSERWLATEGAFVRLWDGSSGKLVNSVPLPSIAWHRDALSPDGTRLVSASIGRTVLTEAATGNTLTELNIEPYRFVQDVEWSADGRLIGVEVTRTTPNRFDAEREPGAFLIFDAAGKRVRIWPGGNLSGLLSRRTVAEGGRHLALLPRDDRGETLVFKDVRTGEVACKPALRLGWHSSLKVLPCGRWVVTAAVNWNHASSLTEARADFALVEASSGLVFRRWRGPADPDAPLAFAPDARLLVEGTGDGEILVRDTLSGKVLATLTGHRGAVTSVAFSPDGRKLVSGGDDTTALVWDATPWYAAASKALKAPAPSAATWDALAANEASCVTGALAELLGSPEAAVKLLRQHLKPATAAEVEALRALIADLDDGRYPVRQQAVAKLRQQGAPVGPLLEAQLAGKPTLEQRQRVERLLAELPDLQLPPETLRQQRALLALEWLGTPEAVELLEQLSSGTLDAWLTREAAAVLKRVKRR